MKQWGPSGRNAGRKGRAELRVRARTRVRSPAGRVLGARRVTAPFLCGRCPAGLWRWARPPGERTGGEGPAGRGGAPRGGPGGAEGRRGE